MSKICVHCEREITGEAYCAKCGGLWKALSDGRGETLKKWEADAEMFALMREELVGIRDWLNRALPDVVDLRPSEHKFCAQCLYYNRGESVCRLLRVPLDPTVKATNPGCEEFKPVYMIKPDRTKGDGDEDS